MAPLVITTVLGYSVTAVAQAPLPYRQTVVVTGAASPIELDRTTRVVTVITREQIESLPVHSIADVLRLASPVDVRARGERGVQADFAIRGAHFGQMLVLVDGVRLNDAQSGHHNGDIPVPLDAVERIEVLHGPGSSLFGADAFGGTVNVITRASAAAPSLVVHGGSFGLAGARGQAVLSHGRQRHALAASLERSAGFVGHRDYATAIVRGRTTLGDRSGVSVSFLRKEFGARNFYGATATGDAMSREWTNQTLVAGDHAFAVGSGWEIAARGSYRSHGDRFVFHEPAATPPSIHRTHEALAAVSASRAAGLARLTLGFEAGGGWIGSNNLGDHDLHRASGFAEWRQPIATRIEIEAGLRADRYSEFGASWSPAAGVGYRATQALRLKASVARAFRVPTFTERFYSDRNHLARRELSAEHAWSGEAGADLFLASGWTLTAAGFRRTDSDVIDWVCANRTCGTAAATERWRTFNVRNVDTSGVEVGVRRTFASGAFVQAGYSGLRQDAAALTQLSKYVLDFAPRSFTAAAAVALTPALRVAPRLEYRRRSRPTGISDYALLDLRVSHRVSSAFDLFVEGTNLFDVSYQEIPGVRMPGAAMTVSLALRGR